MGSKKAKKKKKIKWWKSLERVSASEGRGGGGRKGNNLPPKLQNGAMRNKDKEQKVHIKGNPMCYTVGTRRLRQRGLKQEWHSRGPCFHLNKKNCVFIASIAVRFPHEIKRKTLVSARAFQVLNTKNPQKTEGSYSWWTDDVAFDTNSGKIDDDTRSSDATLSSPNSFGILFFGVSQSRKGAEAAICIQPPG